MKMTEKLKSAIHKSLRIVIENWAVFLGLLVTFSGITLSNMIPNVWNSFDFVKRSKAEKEIESVKICANVDYIEDHLGIPIIKYEFEYTEPDSYDPATKQDIPGEKTIGKKVIYNNDYYLMTLYYSDNDTLLGYVMSLKDKKCNPKILDNLINLSSSIKDEKILIQTEKTSVFHQLSPRNDNSIFYLESHYHHLSTNGLHVGLGYLDLVERDNDSSYRNEWRNELQKYVSNAIETFGKEDIVLDGDDSTQIKTLNNLTASIHELKPNTISLFDEDDIDVISFFKKEFSTDLGICEQDYILINY